MNFNPLWHDLNSYSKAWEVGGYLQNYQKEPMLVQKQTAPHTQPQYIFSWKDEGVASSLECHSHLQ